MLVLATYLAMRESWHVPKVWFCWKWFLKEVAPYLWCNFGHAHGVRCEETIILPLSGITQRREQGGHCPLSFHPNLKSARCSGLSHKAEREQGNNSGGNLQEMISRTSRKLKCVDK